MTPTQRTLKRVRDNGSVADVVERWIAIPNHPGGGVRKDMFGFIDIVELRGDSIVGIQCTTVSNNSKRLIKIKTECREAAVKWIATGAHIEVWSWRKLQKKVDRKSWQPRIVAIRFEDLE